ncbi:MAG: hypothetical protein H6727_08800 [Myxococcales bacterium]|nr:hypothetical protein [Myxococcales bacterium]
MTTQRDRLFVLWILAVLWCVGGSSPAAAQTKKKKAAAYHAAMTKAQTLYNTGKWGDALEGFRKALKELRGKPMFQKSEVYVYIGMSLAQMNKSGMALKSFEVALYQDVCLQLPSGEKDGLKALFEEARQRVSRRGGVVGRSSSCGKTPNNGETPRQPSGGAAVSPWPWVALGVGALLLTGGVVFMTNALGQQGQLDSWKANTDGKGYKQEDLDVTSQPLKDTSGWQLPTGIGLLVAGVLAAGASVPLFIFLQGKKPTSTAARSLPPQSPQHAMVRLLDAR